ncbi:MAG TPA: SRPBCC family protein [Egibacteraceae bacterium]|nr:SRPBCC family protein [Egibacteraceae bacterium]
MGIASLGADQWSRFMGQVRASAERDIDASPDVVYAFVRDYRDQRPRILPPNYLDYAVEEGGTGAGTVVSYRLQAGRRERPYRMRVSEPAEHTLTETDTDSSLVTTWTVKPGGGGSRVQIETTWEGASGIGGFFERRFAPAGLRRIHDDMLARLADVLA